MKLNDSGISDIWLQLSTAYSAYAPILTCQLGYDKNVRSRRQHPLSQLPLAQRFKLNTQSPRRPVPLHVHVDQVDAASADLNEGLVAIGEKNGSICVQSETRPV